MTSASLGGQRGLVNGTARFRAHGLIAEPADPGRRLWQWHEPPHGGHDPTGPDHQRNSRDPAIRPIRPEMAIPAVYQIAMNGTALSGQWKAYTQAPRAPAVRPAASPAERRRVGARPRIAQKRPASTGAARSAINH